MTIGEMIAVSRALVAALAAVAISAVAATTPSASPAKAGASSATPSVPAITRTARFSQLGARSALQLRGDGDSATLDFGCRSDELVTRAILRLRYVGSPALAPGVSHVRLALNGDTIATLPFAAATAGALTERTVEVDPRLLIGFNKLTLTLIAAAGSDAPQTEAAPGLWADIAVSSELELTVQPLTLADDLAILPEPFFDTHDQRRLVVPFAFGAKPSQATLRAAADVASWLGVLARWRGVRTPPSFDAPTTGHTIAFVANDERPSFLASVPPATGPELRLMTHPGDARSKLLLVMGRNGEDLKVAADALVSGVALSGARVQVKRVEDKAVAPYEAPAWVALGEPTKLGDLTDWAQQLEASGRPPELDAVKVQMRLPPDLAAWRGPGIPLTLKLQYTPPACATDAYLEVAINDTLIQSVPLRFANEAIIETKQLFIPYYRLRSRSELAFAFRFPVKDEPQCRDPRSPPIKAVVLPESTIDFTGIPHYVRMPNLAHFATIGYPFTRRADLAETVVVLPDEAAPADIETMLALMARMGEATGRPATRVRITTPKDAGALADADILVIGAPPQQTLLARWTEQMPITFSGIQRASVSSVRLDAVYDWLGLAPPPDTAVATQVNFEGTGPAAALYAFESPVTRGRSVVVVTALVPDQMARVVDALDDRDMRRAVKGSAAFILGDKVQSVLVGPTYTVGHMPFYTGWGYWLSQRPEIVGTGATAILILLGFLAYVIRGRFVAWRKRRRG